MISNLTEHSITTQGFVMSHIATEDSKEVSIIAIYASDEHNMLNSYQIESQIH